MRILFLTHAFNSLTQRLYVELAERGHELSVEFDIKDEVAIEAVDIFRPDLVIAPYLRRAIPQSVWSRHVCLVVHPGPPGDRGPSSLDWAIHEAKEDWGVTVLQANAEMDGGPVWAFRTFPMRLAPKASLYRREVTEAAVAALLEALAKIESGGRPDPAPPGTWRPVMKQEMRAIDWNRDDTETVLRKIHAADGFPGVLDVIGGRAVHLFDAHPETTLMGRPGVPIARYKGAVCLGTVDGAVWIGHVREPGEGKLKLPATAVLGDIDAPEFEPDTWAEIGFRERDGVGVLTFPLYNGAMSTAQCRRLEAAFRHACSRAPKVIVLAGGEDFWCNGIHLNAIEAAASPADESMANIEAMDDLCRTILSATDRYVIAAMRGNAGAGGVFLAMAADRVLARDGAVLNPHYKNMGNLYGSEYWTYLLPRRVGEDGIGRIMGRRLPLGAAQAERLGLIDGTFGDFDEVLELARNLDVAPLIAEKKARRAADEAVKPLDAYRAGELERMRLNFYGFDPSYHVARYNFVHKVPHSRTPLFLASHRRRRAV
ncbi:MAG: hydrogenase maturation protein [Magnetospirillum sp. WYHS-4]